MIYMIDYTYQHGPMGQSDYSKSTQINHTCPRNPENSLNAGGSENRATSDLDTEESADFGSMRATNHLVAGTQHGTNI